jgi:hypothetical protein
MRDVQWICAQRDLVGNLWERDNLANPGEDGKIIWIFRKWDWGTWTGLI